MPNRLFSRLLTIILSVLMLVASVSFMSVTAADYAEPDFDYIVLEDGTIEIRSANPNLTEIAVPETIDGYTVTSIDTFAFEDTQVPIVSLPDTLTRIGFGAFDDSATYNDENNWENGMLYIGKNLIAVNDELIQDVVIKDGTRLIAEDAINGSVNSVSIPASVEYIGDGAFNCFSQKGITVSPDNKNYTSLDGCLYNKDKTYLISYYVTRDFEGVTADIIDTVKVIDDLAFRYSGAVSYKEIILPAGLEKVSVKAFGELSVDCVTVHPDNKYYTSKDGVLYNKDITKLIYYPRSFNSQTTEYMAPSTLKSVGERAFAGVGNLVSITLPEGLEFIGDSAFLSTYSLESINIPSTVTHVGKQAFNWSKLYKDNNTEAENRPLYIDNCLVAADFIGDGSDYVIAEGTRLIADEGFHYSNYTSVKLPDSVKIIGEGAFRNSKITSVVLPEGVTYIGDYAFELSKLESVTLPASVTHVGKGLFLRCRDLTNFTLPETITRIEEEMFYSCRSLTGELEIPDHIKEIGKGAFRLCGLEGVVIPKSVTSIEDGALGGVMYIKGYKGTCAETYASDNYIKFYPLDSEEPSTSEPTQPTTGTDPVTPPEPVFEIGDANLDGTLNIKDATSIQKHIASLEEFTTEQKLLADFNSDTTVNIKDATAIQKRIAGLE